LKNLQILGVDAGGTFTDFVLIQNSDGKPGFRTHKVMSTPADPEQAILTGIREMGLGELVASGGLHIVHGSTVATNAILEGKGVKTAFVSNYGFADILTLGRQTRPNLYGLEFSPQNPPVPTELCLETGGRLAADGSVITPLCELELDQLIEQLKSLEPEAVAINLIFSFLDDGFEQKIAAAIRKAKLPIFISCSSSVLPEYKEYERGIATWLNATLGPVVRNYLNRLRQELGESKLRIMQSSGETLSAAVASESAVNLLLSGPAAGLNAIQFLGENIGEKKFISFDMGGTSTDVALFDGKITITNEGVIANYPVAVPMMDMHTIGAGGGSIAFVDSGGMLRVGPLSAGADPGPACYARGGTDATVTDANLVLGRLHQGSALAGSIRLDNSLAREALQLIAERIGLSVEETALGIISVANQHMASAIRMISANRGFDPDEFTLASFGGAGGMHVCALADRMRMRRAIVPVHCGVLSALGMVAANSGRQISKTVNISLADAQDELIAMQFEKLADSATQQMLEESSDLNALQIELSADLRYSGQSYTLNVPWESSQQAISEFHASHERRYGYKLEIATELVNLRVNVVVTKQAPELPTLLATSNCNNMAKTGVYGHVGNVMVFERQTLTPGESIVGPAIITEFSATTYVAPSWIATVDQFGNILLTKPEVESPI
jgi:N-methylhydantoinase A